MSNISFHLPWATGLLFFLLLLSAFFSGSETALTRARRARLRLWAEEGNRGAKLASQLLDKPDHMLAAILLGNNFVNIAASSLATALLVVRFGEAGIIYATAAMTVVVLVFSEVLPKTIAVAHAERIASHIAMPMHVIIRLFSPVTGMIMALINAIKRLMRIPQNTDSGLSHKELATIIDISAETGVLDSAREQMLMSSLGLHEVPVKALMTPRKDMVMLDAGQSVSACLEYILQQPYSRYPAYNGKPDNLIGIVHLRDIMKIRNRQQRLAEAIIWRHSSFIPAGKNALAQLFDFQTRHQHMAIVVDEYGDIDGLICLEDIIEEIVGEIVDESDTPALPEMWPQPDGSLVAAGTIPLHDINQALDIDLPQEGATTIGGLIVEILGGQPEGKMCLPMPGLQLEVLSLQDNWVRRVQVRRVTSE